ncbi:phage/plasmid primase, P4 family [Candidatus Zixiibacteriota bacterium]
MAKKLNLSGIPNGPRQIGAIYDYFDENRQLLFQVVREVPKGFKQRRPDGNEGWIWRLNGTRRVLYRLPELLRDPESPVWITEGEKDTGRLVREGLVATTNPGGVGKWRSEYNQCLRGREIVILPDNDEAGARHAHTVARSLSSTVKSVKIVRLPHVPHKGDVSDWLDAGQSIEKLHQLAAAAPEWNCDVEERDNFPGTPGRPQSVQEAVDDPHRLAGVYLDHHGTDNQGRCTIRFWRDQWWRWTGTHYRIFEKNDLRPEITSMAKAEIDRWNRIHDTAKEAKKITCYLVTNIMQALAGMVLVPADIEQPAWLGPPGVRTGYLSMANGLIDLEKCLADQSIDPHAHTPELFTQVHLSYPYDRAAGCKRWEAFLDEVLEGDQERIAILQEWFGYCLTLDTSRQKFLMLEGDGANGKSVVCETLAVLLSKENVSHVPLELFGQRFQLTQTLGRLANIAAEIGELDKAAEGTLKAFTSGDRMYFDRKCLPGVEAYPTARLVLSTNNRPRFSDRSSGLWRRMILLPFGVVIPEERQDRCLAARLRQELPGIFQWAIAGLRRLRAQGHFTTAQVCNEAIEDYRVESNPARQFLLENVVETPEDLVSCGTLYRHYRKWCDDSGYRALGNCTFGKEVMRLFPRTRVRRLGSRGERERHYEGIAVS